MSGDDETKWRSDATLAVEYAKIARNAHISDVPEVEKKYLQKARDAASAAVALGEKDPQAMRQAMATLKDPEILAEHLRQASKGSRSHIEGALARHEDQLHASDRIALATELYRSAAEKDSLSQARLQAHDDGYYATHHQERDKVDMLRLEHFFYERETQTVAGYAFVPDGENRRPDYRPKLALNSEGMERAKELFAAAGGSGGEQAEKPQLSATGKVPASAGASKLLS